MKNHHVDDLKHSQRLAESEDRRGECDQIWHLRQELAESEDRRARLLERYRELEAKQKQLLRDNSSLLEYYGISAPVRFNDLPVGAKFKDIVGTTWTKMSTHGEAENNKGEVTLFFGDDILSSTSNEWVKFINEIKWHINGRNGLFDYRFFRIIDDIHCAAIFADGKSVKYNLEQAIYILQICANVFRFEYAQCRRTIKKLNKAMNAKANAKARTKRGKQNAE